MDLDGSDTHLCDGLHVISSALKSPSGPWPPSSRPSIELHLRSASPWIVCQLGAREHYAVARAMQGAGLLELMVTDAWVSPNHVFARSRLGFGERFHDALAKAPVAADNVGIAAFETVARVCGRNGWTQITERNAWFQRMALARLARVPNDGVPRTLFAYSYAARNIFEFARMRGWRTVLGQIDGGLADEQLVTKLYSQSRTQAGDWEPAPNYYWESWFEECALADRIVVNSAWSRQALEATGIPREALRIVPLAYDAPQEATHFRRSYPARFTSDRPLRVLFLGQISLRKGAGVLLEAARQLAEEPVVFWFVGQRHASISYNAGPAANVEWFGSVPRGQTARYYRDADVFVFPTFSDGFGLTQLEAQAWKLPVIASQFCGEVVQDSHNGILLQELTPHAIAQALRKCITSPKLLESFSARAAATGASALIELGRRLAAIVD